MPIPFPADVGVPLYLRLPGLRANATALAPLRDRLMVWARGTDLDDDQVSDVGLAVYEAMANVLDHAYDQPGGRFDLYAYRHDGRVTVTVTDSGRWRPAQRNKQQSRGRGLLIIKRLVRELELIRHSGGTVVRMTWQANRRTRLTLPRVAPSR